MVTAAIVTWVRARATAIRPHQGRSNQPENIMKWIAFKWFYLQRGALYANPQCAGKDWSGKDFFCKNYTPRDNRVGTSRRALEGRREEAVGAVHMRPEPQPFAGLERYFLRRQELAARKEFEV